MKGSAAAAGSVQESFKSKEELAVTAGSGTECMGEPGSWLFGDMQLVYGHDHHLRIIVSGGSRSIAVSLEMKLRSLEPPEAGLSKS